MACLLLDANIIVIEIITGHDMIGTFDHNSKTLAGRPLSITGDRIITDRDIVLEIVAPNLNIDEFCAGDIMSGNIEKVKINQELWETIHLMREKGVRRIVIVDNDDYLVGLLSVDDILESLVEEFGEVVNLIAREQKREIATRTVP